MDAAVAKALFAFDDFERQLDKGHWKLEAFGAGKPSDITRAEFRNAGEGILDLTLEVRGDSLGEKCIGGVVQAVHVDHETEGAIEAMVVILRRKGDLYRLCLMRPHDAPPGWPISYAPPYGPVDMRDRQQKGEYFLRSPYGTQPSVARVGDVLATGQRICDAPRDAGDEQNILLNLDGAWEVVPAWVFLGFKTDQPNPDRRPWEEWVTQYRHSTE